MGEKHEPVAKNPTQVQPVEEGRELEEEEKEALGLGWPILCG
jgi:hypothetical protein